MNELCFYNLKKKLNSYSIKFQNQPTFKQIFFWNSIIK
ncbi:MAG: hypothetical protein KatS3mg027_2727 [Bacteroidia bacterium]|nr:MAG: hypothetical protein KatS3mg027_2727 [Bacteroidia bacterium]